MEDKRLEHQKELSSIALSILGGSGYVLAGSGAIREHGLTSRPTEDIDLFGSYEEQEGFPDAADRLIDGLEDAGYGIEVYRRTDRFMTLAATKDGLSQQVDMGIDYREYPPKLLSVGFVLDVRDAVANKVCAVFSRGYPRDYIDLDSIRRNSGFADDELIDLAMNADPGFTEGLFAQALLRVSALELGQVERYGVTAESLDSMKRDLRSWASELRAPDIQAERARDVALRVSQGEEPSHQQNIKR